MVDDSTPIEALPNEILIAVLSKFPTESLLPLTLTCHRFHDLIIRILHHRLIEAAAINDHKLILECFHPARKLSTPYLYCDYLGTGALNVSGAEEEDLFQDVQSTERLGKLAGLYSHFRPLKPDFERRMMRSHPAGGLITPPPDGLVDGHNDFVCQNVHLESYELFSQLCTIVNIVKNGPKRGLFLSCVKVSEGLTRIWREWLNVQAKSEIIAEESAEAAESRILWADNNRTVGLKMRVIERSGELPPIALSPGEDPPVLYTLQYEELVIKTTQLLLMVEQSINQEVNHLGKAIVIGSWDR